MIEENIVNSLRSRYQQINPLVFHRSMEKTNSAVELFDILESIPSCAFYWDDSNKKWTKSNDFVCIGKAKDILN